jgi:predicted ferric reductase
MTLSRTSVRPWSMRARRPDFTSALYAVAWILFVTNGAIVVWLWLRGGGISAVHDVGSLCTSVGRITGLLGAYLLLIQLLLLARIPWVERRVGFDHLTVWHRRNGKLCLYLVLAHVVFITVGYQQLDHISMTAEIRSLLTNYPGMIAATIGTAMMIVIVGTSLVIVRKRLRYEFWYLVHLTAYLSILLAWFHEIPTGNEFALNASQAAYWTAIYLITVALLVFFRLAQPLLASLRYRLRVEDVRIEAPGVTTIRISGRGLDRLNARAGQFFLWRFLGRSLWWESHPFSLSESPDGQSLRITVKDLGDFTHRLARVRPGTRVMAEGPFGVFTAHKSKTNRVLLIAGGIGITPIRSLIDDLSGDIVVLYRTIRDDELLFRAELDARNQYPGVRIHYVTGDHRTAEGARLLTAEHLKELVPDLAERDTYICGPPAMADLIARNARDAGVPRRNIHLERFAL